MKIGIDISQLAFEGTGVANYLKMLVSELLVADKENEYMLFFSSLRRDLDINFVNQIKRVPGIKENRVRIKKFKFPPSLLDMLWNKMHVLPIESLIGDVDVFISSDWTQPPLKSARGMTILYDLIVYKYPEETAQSIVETQKRRLHWVKKECEKIICISISTKKDAQAILGIEEKKLTVVYPGMTL